jgi:ribosomal protein L21E
VYKKGSVFFGEERKMSSGEEVIAGAIFSGAQIKSASSQLFQNGERVRIGGGASEYERRFSGRTGKILRYIGLSWFRVEFDDGEVARIEKGLIKKI